MFYTLVMNNHALTVVMRRWQLTEHIAYLRGEKTCSVRCHGSMTADRACCIPLEWITMLCPCNETMTTDGECFIYEWYYTILLPLHEMMTNDGAWFIHEWYITMLWLLSWDEYHWRQSILWPLSWDDNIRLSMFHTLGMNNHALYVVMRQWQMTEHVSYLTYI